MAVKRSNRACLAVIAAVTALTLAATGVAQADDGSQVTTNETLRALADTPGVLAQSDTVKASADQDSVSVSRVGGTTVDIPRNASGGVLFRGVGASPLTITPPAAEAGGDGTRVNPGLVAYPGSDGSATAIQASEGGGAGVLTVIANGDAPNEYTTDLTVPGGGFVRLTRNGGARVVNGSGHLVALVQPAWARDAAGRSVSTYYSTNGSELTQHVDLTDRQIVYPVTADPFFIPAWAVVQIIRCGAGGYLGWISAGGWRWYARALAVAGGCLIGVR